MIFHCFAISFTMERISKEKQKQNNMHQSTILFPEQASLFLASTHTMKSSKSKLRKKIFNQATLDQNYHPSPKEKTRLKILYASINFQSHDNVMINLVAF